MIARSFVASTAVLLISAAYLAAVPAAAIAQEEPMVRVDIEDIRDDLATEFNTGESELVLSIDVPPEIAAAACGGEAAELTTQAAEGLAECSATTAAPELVEYLKTTQDTEGDEIPDLLLAPEGAPA